MNRIQVNSTLMGLAIDFDNPLAWLGGFLFGEIILACCQHNWLIKRFYIPVTANIPINRFLTHEPLPFPCPRTPPLPSLMGLYFLDDNDNNIPNHQKIKAYEQT